MKLIDVAQGSPEWLAVHIGIPTASRFGRLLTPTGNPSEQAKKYMNELIAERLLGVNLISGDDDAPSPWMQRGSDLEVQAGRYYELQRDVDCHKVGFLLHDSGRFGCSPDRLIGGDGLLEIKCPKASIHVGYLLDDR